MSHLIWIITLLPLTFLAVVIIVLTAALLKSSSHATGRKSEKFPNISVIIPFRNEESHLWNLLHSLSKITYQGSWEIVLINDRSEDRSIDVVNTFRLRYPRLRILQVHSEFDQSVPLTSKQQALERGVNQAKYQWLAFTDADVRVTPQWLEAFSEQIRCGKQFVYGHTAIFCAKRTLFSAFQMFQLRFLFCTAYAFSRTGLMGSCMGNNICISRRLYEKIGGQHGVGYSIVEDRELMKKASVLGNAPTPTHPFYPTVYTYPEPTLRSFYAQARRWALGGITGSWMLFAVMVSLAVENGILILTMAGYSTPIVAVPSGINFLLLWIFALYSFKKTGAMHQALFFPLFYACMIVESVILAIGLACNRRIYWKGQELKSA